MKARLALVSLLALAALVSHGAAQERAALADPRETRLAELRQLTFGGENAEAYWSPDGRELIFQSTRPPFACDQIFRLGVAPGAEPKLVSSGEGRTTCAYFTATGILYASTHLAGPACPAPPDRSQGYVWPVHPEYELFAAARDGADRRRLTDNQAYDAEATVCARDGSIVFTSSRDGDLELYRMDADGGNVQRLTDAPGYDGGAFFSPDCSRIVWRASRPRRPRSWRTIARSWRAAWCGRPGSSCGPRTPTAASRARSPTSAAPRSRPPSSPPATASSSARTTPIRRAASSISGRSTSTAPASSASRTPPASTASRCSRPTGGGSPSPPIATSRGPARPTSSWRAGRRTRRRPRPKRLTLPIAIWPTCAGWPTTGARDAASAPRVWTRLRAGSRSGSASWGSRRRGRRASASASRCRSP